MDHRPPEASADTPSGMKILVGRQRSPQIGRLTGLRRRWRRFESCRGHQTCFFRTHGDKITVGIFKIIFKRADQHVPRTAPVPAQNAPGAIGRQGRCLRPPDKIQPLQDVLGTSPRLPVKCPQLMLHQASERLGQLCPFDRAIPGDEQLW